MATTPVFWPGKSHGQGSLVGQSPWSSKEWDTTEQLNNSNKGEYGSVPGAVISLNLSFFFYLRGHFMVQA